MPQAFDPAAAFVQSLPDIDRMAEKLCRRYHVSEEAEDFASLVKMKLMADDYAALRSFRGESALRTFLLPVVTRAFHEWQRATRGRWRNSAQALRLGPPVPELEALVQRDGVPLREAAERLRAAGRTDKSDRELAALLSQCRDRAPLRPVEVGPAPLDSAVSDRQADGRVTAEEDRRRREHVTAALQAALRSALTPEEQVLVRMVFIECRKVADAARLLGVPQKPLYRKLEQALAKLRGALEDAGVGAAEVRELFAGGEEVG
jgi:RNA polymerase sigma factor for flagellar operon FliA